MIHRTPLAIFTAFVLFSCSNAYAQFTVVSPSDLGFNVGDTVNGIFDISTLMGKAANSVTLEVSNGRVNSVNGSWTVSNSQTTTFSLGGTSGVQGFVNHGANLGSEAAQNGPLSRDGISAAAGETWTFSSNLDTDYTLGQQDNDYFVDYTGPETNQSESNSQGFLWVSDQAISSVTVFSSNTLDLNNNYSIGFQEFTAIPEPSAACIGALAGLLFLRRQRG